GEDAAWHWNGATWTALSTGSNLSAVWTAGPNDVWTVGTYATLQHWDGTWWSTVASADTPSLNDVWGSAPNDVWAVGMSGVEEEGAILHWNGSTWSLVFTGGGGFGGYNAVWGAAANDVWAVGNVGDIAHWNGSSWKVTSVISPSDASFFADVWGSSA